LFGRDAAHLRRDTAPRLWCCSPRLPPRPVRPRRR
jgi:hypothetical protein